MTIIEQLFWLAIVSMGVASVSWTITQEEIFKEPREYCRERSESGRTLIEQKFFYVFTCEYCLSHWVSLGFLVLTGFRLLIDDWRGYVIAFFVTSWTANQFMSFYRRIRVGIKYENVLAEKEKERGDDE